MKIIVERAGYDPTIGLNMESKAKVSMNNED
jgi:hypothetical protein